MTRKLYPWVLYHLATSSGGESPSLSSVCVCVLPLNHLPRRKSMASNRGATRVSLLTNPGGEEDRVNRAPEAAHVVPVASTSAAATNVMVLNERHSAGWGEVLLSRHNLTRVHPAGLYFGSTSGTSSSHLSSLSAASSGAR